MFLSSCPMKRWHGGVGGSRKVSQHRRAGNVENQSWGHCQNIHTFRMRRTMEAWGNSKSGSLLAGLLAPLLLVDWDFAGDVFVAVGLPPAVAGALLSAVTAALAVLLLLLSADVAADVSGASFRALAGR